MEAGDVLKMYLGIMAVIFLFWLFAGGPNTKFRHGGSTFFSPSALPQSQGENAPPRTKEEIESKLQDAKAEAETIQQKIDDIKYSSPYKGKLSLNVGLARSTELAQQYLILQRNPLATEPISITGWTLRSKITGKSAIIGQAVKIPGIPSRTSLESIILNSNDAVYINTERSPAVYSFRINRCTGYLSEAQQFTPYMQYDCPRAIDSKALKPPYPFNDACLDFVEQVPQCRRPTNIPEKLSLDCKSYLHNEINYASCVREYEKTPNFFKNEWRIYLDRDELLWKQKRETIELIDPNNKLVDTLTY